VERICLPEAGKMKREYRHKLSLLCKNIQCKQEGTIMPVPKKERITSKIDSQTVEQASPNFPDQQTFHEHLRTLTRKAVRVVIEEVMREELQAFLGAAWGESTPQRNGNRNGTYTRDLATSSGSIENLGVPRDREGHFHTQVFDR
jgi:putative transposase